MSTPPHSPLGRPVAWSKLTSRALALATAVLAPLLGSSSGQVSRADAASNTLVVTTADDGRQVNLRRGDQLQVLLTDIAGTGYSWGIESNDPNLLAPEGQETRQDPGPPPLPGGLKPLGVVGGPMQVSFLFRAVGKGRGELRLRHWRTWEGPGSVNRRFKLQLRVIG